MTPARNFDAVVVGASVNGLVAATYLAKAGLRVLLAEARNKLGGRCETAAISDGFEAPLIAHTLYALDPQMVQELKLARHGLAFVIRDMPMIVAQAGSAPIVLGRDIRAAARSIAPYSEADAKAYPEFRQQLFSLARKMRAIWWNENELRLGVRDRNALEKIQRQSVCAYLDSRFEMDALKAALAFDATCGGLSSLEPGSALTLLWRASQEMCGLQGAVAVPKGGAGAFVNIVTAAAQSAGVEIRTGIRVTHIHAEADLVSGIELATGEMVSAPMVLSGLPKRQTLLELSGGANLGLDDGRALLSAPGDVSAAKVVFAVSGLPSAFETSTSKGRMVLADRLEGLIAARGQAWEGGLPDDLAMELVIPTLTDPTLAPLGQHVISILVRPVPANNAEWHRLKAPLVERVVLAIERIAPGFAKHISAFKVVSPPEMEELYGSGDETGGPVSVARMLAPWAERIKTGTKGLYLCGASAEPIGAVSGRAGRIAAAIALAERKT